jgi:hypothetical protein
MIDPKIKGDFDDIRINETPNDIAQSSESRKSIDDKPHYDSENDGKKLKPESLRLEFPSSMMKRIKNENNESSMRHTMHRLMDT